MLESLTIILPIVALFCVLIIAFVNVCILIRRYYPIKINCWFCNNYTKVEYEERNSFHCSSCQQYNGFNEDGDYNKQIPEQHNEMLNRLPWGRQITRRTSNGLCRLCNNNQQLKIHQLATFVPLHENSYDIEIEHFKNLLEKAYKLCPKCEQILHHTLSEQNRLLIGQRILSIHKKSIAFLDINKSSKHFTTQQKQVLFNFLLYSILILISILLLIESIQNDNLSERNTKHVMPYYLHPYISKISKYLRRIYHIYKYYFESVNNCQEVQEIYSYLNSTLAPVKTMINNKLNMNITHNQYLDYLMGNSFLRRDQESFYEIALSTCGLFLQLCTFLLHKHNVYITATWIFLLIIPYILFDAYIVSVVKVLTLVTLLFKTIQYRRMKTIIKSNNLPNGSSTLLTDSTASGTANFSDTSKSDLSSSTNYFDMSNASKASFRDFNLSDMSTRSRKNIRYTTIPVINSPIPMFGSKAVIENPLLKSCQFRNRSFSAAEAFRGYTEKNTAIVTADDLQAGIMNLSLGKSTTSTNNYKARYQRITPNVFKSRPVLVPPSFVYNNYYNKRPTSWCTDNWLKREEHPFNSRCSSQTSGFVSIEPNDLNRSLPNDSTSSSICDDFDRASVVSEPIYSQLQSRFGSSAFTIKSGLNENRSKARISNAFTTRNCFNNKFNNSNLFKPIVFNSDELSGSYAN